MNLRRMFRLLCELHTSEGKRDRGKVPAAELEFGRYALSQNFSNASHQSRSRSSIMSVPLSSGCLRSTPRDWYCVRVMAQWRLACSVNPRAWGGSSCLYLCVCQLISGVWTCNLMKSLSEVATHLALAECNNHRYSNGVTYCTDLSIQRNPKKF